MREFIRRLEAVGLTVESTPGHYRVLREGKLLRKRNGMPFMLPFSPDTIRWRRAAIVELRKLGIDLQRELFEASYRVRAEMGDLSRMALSLNNIGATLFAAQDTSRAREHVTQALELAREVGDRRHVHAALDTLAWIALAEGGAGEARELFTEALSQALEIANQPAARVSLYGLAAAAAAAGDGRLVARLAASAGPDPGGSAISIDPATRAVFDRNLAEARAQTDPAEWEEAWAAGTALTVEQAAAEVLGT